MHAGKCFIRPSRAPFRPRNRSARLYLSSQRRIPIVRVTFPQLTTGWCEPSDRLKPAVRRQLTTLEGDVHETRALAFRRTIYAPSRCTLCCPALDEGNVLAAPDPLSAGLRQAATSRNLSLAADAATSSPAFWRRWFSATTAEQKLRNTTGYLIGNEDDWVHAVPNYAALASVSTGTMRVPWKSSISSMASFRVPARSCPIWIAFGVMARVVVDAQRNLELSIRAER